MSQQVIAATRLCRNKIFRNVTPGGKHASCRETAGGAGLTTMPRLQRLGVQVSALGRCTPDDEAALRFLQSEGIVLRMQRAEGPGAVNAVLDGDKPTVLRILPGKTDWSPTREEAAYLSASPARALALCGSLPHEYAEFLITTAAARGQWIFWNPGTSADLSLAGVGRVIVQVSYAQFGDGRVHPRELALRLLATSGAAVCVVRNGPAGAYAAQRSPAQVLYAPALALPGGLVRTRVSASDAFFAGLIAGWLLVEGESRLERALHLARLLGAYHLSGAPGGSWEQVGLFDRLFYSRKAAIAAAA